MLPIRTLPLGGVCDCTGDLGLSGGEAAFDLGFLVFVSTAVYDSVGGGGFIVGGRRRPLLARKDGSKYLTWMHLPKL